MVDLIENSEIDFWNAFAYCVNEVPGDKPLHTEKYSAREVKQVFSEAEYFLKYFHSKMKPNNGSAVEHLNRNLLADNYCSNFFKKVKALTESPSNELIALKVLAKISSCMNIDSQFLFHSFGFTKWIEEMCSRDRSEIFLEAWKIIHNLDKSTNDVFLDGIYPVMPPVAKKYIQKPEFDIVLVHGVMGGAAWTWRQNDSKKGNPVISQKERMEILHNDCSNFDVIKQSYSWIWPLDWFNLIIKKPFRLIAVDYPAFWWKWADKYTSEDKSLNLLSEEFLHKLKKAGIGSRPIIWITHSMGGLIVKRILELEHDHLSNNISDKNSKLNLLTSTHGIVFLSVPHFGSPLASWSCLFSSFLRPSPYVCDMRADAPELLSLHNTFLQNCEKFSIKVLTLNEGKTFQPIRHGPKFKFIPSKYGDPCIGEFYEVEASHLDVCKPYDMSDQIFQLIEKFIFKIINPL